MCTHNNVETVNISIEQNSTVLKQEEILCNTAEISFELDPNGTYTVIARGYDLEGNGPVFAGLLEKEAEGPGKVSEVEITLKDCAADNPPSICTVD